VRVSRDMRYEFTEITMRDSVERVIERV